MDNGGFNITPHPYATGETIDIGDLRIYEGQLEEAARRLCRLRGQNPDDKVGHGPEPSSDGVVLDVLMYSPRWQIVRNEIIEHIRVDYAFKSVGPFTFAPQPKHSQPDSGESSDE